MTPKKSFTWNQRLQSFRHAFRGIGTMLVSQHNAWIHLAATLFVFVLGAYFHLSRMEWCAVALAVVSVWVAEAFNTALEFLADAVSPERHPLVGKAKDVAAGGVLIAAIGAVAVGLLIFGPHLLGWTCGL